MKALAIIVGLSLIAMVLRDAFDSIVLPRRVARRFRFTRFFYRTTWRPWNWAAKLLSARRREAFLSYFGPLSLLMLLVLWAIGLVVGFGLIEWVAGISGAAHERVRLMHALYYSGTTLFTLGLGDVVPLTHFGKFITVAEAGHRPRVLALVIGYGPVIYQSFRAAKSPSLCSMRAPGRRRPPANCFAATPMLTASKRFTNCCANGNAGRPNCSKATSPTRSSLTTVRSTATNRGSRRLRRFSIRARSSASASKALASARPN